VCAFDAAIGQTVAALDGLGSSFFKGGFLGLGGGNKIPLSPPFSKGEVGMGIWGGMARLVM